MRLALIVALVGLALAGCSGAEPEADEPLPEPTRPTLSGRFDVPSGPPRERRQPMPVRTREATGVLERRVPAYLQVVTGARGTPAPSSGGIAPPPGRAALEDEADLLGPTRRFLAQSQAGASLLVALPVHNEPGVRQLLDRLAPRLRTGDIVIVVSGNNGRPLDVAWLNTQAERIRLALPDVKLVAMTAGLGHVQQMAPQLSPLFSGIVYDYEPNYPNEPAFTWDFAATIDHVRALRTAVESSGRTAIALPTGRPLLQRALEQHGWDYGALTEAGGVAFVQTQTYCRKGLPAFEQALDRLAQQHSVGAEWIPQVTVAPNQPNGVSIAEGEACAAAIRARGLPGMMLWWSPAYAGEADELLRRLGR